MKIFCKNRTFIFVLVLLFAAKSMFAMKEEQKINEKFNPEVAMQLISWEDPLYWKRLVIPKQTKQEIFTLIRDNQDTIKELGVMFQAFFSELSRKKNVFFKNFFDHSSQEQSQEHFKLRQCFYLGKFEFKFAIPISLYEDMVRFFGDELSWKTFVRAISSKGFSKTTSTMFEYYKIDEKDRHFFFSFLFVAALKSAPLQAVNKIKGNNYRASTLLFQYYFEGYLHDFVRANNDKKNTEEKKQIYLEKIKQYKQPIEKDPKLPREQNVLHTYIDSALKNIDTLDKKVIQETNLQALKDALNDALVEEKLEISETEISFLPWYKDYAKILKIIAGGLFLGSPLIWFLYKKYKR